MDIKKVIEGIQAVKKTCDEIPPAMPVSEMKVGQLRAEIFNTMLVALNYAGKMAEEAGKISQHTANEDSKGTVEKNDS